MKFCFYKSNYKISYDKSIINDYKFKNIRIELKYLLCGPPASPEEGIYYRILTSKKRRSICIQNIFFYKIQRFPFHIHDYHPFYIYLDLNRRVKFILIDDGHHFSKKISIPQNSKIKKVTITVFLPDHGLTNKLSKFGKIFKPKLIPLMHQKILEWWTYDNMAQLKLRTKLIDPWADGLIPDKAMENDSILNRINYILPMKILPKSENNLFYSFRDEALCPICNKIYLLDLMHVHRNSSVNKYYLIKKQKCINGHEFTIKYDFETGKIKSY
ncbi:MAG: hypothetical protein ACTSQO_01240 [Candidatus Helarchaeota archaeon]